MVRPRLAQPPGHRRALRLVRHSQPAGALGALPPAHAPHARLGGEPAHPGPARAAPPRVARGGHPIGARDGRDADDLRVRGARALATQSDRGPAPGRRPRRRLDPRVHRAALLAEAASLVSARRAHDLQRVPAPTGPGAAGLRHRGPGGGPALARARLRANGDPRGPASEPGAAGGAGTGGGRDLLGRSRGHRPGARGARGPGACPPAAGRAHRVSGRPRGARARGVHHPRGEPVRGDPARLGLRRTRPLLDVPGARDPGRGAAAGGHHGRAARARTRGSARPRAPGLPGAAPARSRGGAARARRGGAGRGPARASIATARS